MPMTFKAAVDQWFCDDAVGIDEPITSIGLTIDEWRRFLDSGGRSVPRPSRWRRIARSIRDAWRDLWWA